MSNPRDERGWRVPRFGNRSWKIYQLMLLGLRDKEIAVLFKEDYNTSSVKVLASTIRHPDRKNEAQNQWAKDNPGKIRATIRVGRKTIYSSYVRKLVKVLGITFTEAVALERKELEKVK